MGTQQTSGRRALVRGLIIDLGVMTVIGVVLALIGPFGSFGDPLVIRLMVWVGFAWVGYALYAPIDTLAQRLAPFLDLPEWSLRVVGCLIASVPMAVVVWSLPRWPDRISWPGASAAFEHYLYVLFIGAVITLVTTIVRHRAQDEPAPRGTGEPRPVPSGAPAPAAPVSSAPVPSVPRARFLDRLPADLGTELIALEMEDHYVRAHTALGSDLVLMRLRDAMAELEGVEGMQVHRSWWVARHSVEDVRRDGRNVRLVLESGLEAPVSRANVQLLKDAGWI